ncbi:MAG: pyruvoyl-dependent arginine decarboxylase [Candidatus Thermoplasmatota archaeon]|nr:pyruvoyl-dependent arginine decarboxylase [Candidatus Thermoplasmatota archaeon]MBU1915204.1 pyruvoyl-dependent arginine decarboxylase [Candidatus Thermoplasmatota archaeon]
MVETIKCCCISRSLFATPASKRFNLVSISSILPPGCVINLREDGRKNSSLTGRSSP